MASGALADCKFLVCRRQMKRLPSASVSLATAKFVPNKRQTKSLPTANFLFAIGKIKFSRRQNLNLSSAIFFMGSTAAACTAFCSAVSSINITSIRKQFPCAGSLPRCGKLQYWKERENKRACKRKKTPRSASAKKKEPRAPRRSHRAPP